MSDLGFGIGVASGVAIEVAKAIIKYAEEVRVNKKQAKNLAIRCDDLATRYREAFRTAENNGLRAGHTYNDVLNYYKQFTDLLNELEVDMKKWSELRFWQRLVQKGDMEDDIQAFSVRVEDAWKFLQCATSLQHLAATNKLTRDFERARVQDTKNDAQLMSDTAKMVADNVQYISHQIADVTTWQVINQLRHENRGREDPLIMDARDELRNALNAYTGPYPPLVIDSSELAMVFDTPFHTGEYSILYRGEMRGTIVVIKKMMLDLNVVEIDTVFRRIRHEAEVWSRLEHPNINKFLGCCRPRDEMPFLVSPWMANGDARTYLRQHPDVNPQRWILDIVEGLKYLHGFQPPIVHGNLRGSHVLLDENLNACLSDFGISYVVNSAYPAGSRPPKDDWSSPEVLDGKAPTTESDVFSFARVILEFLTRRDPLYKERKNPSIRRNMIRTGQMPDFPGSGSESIRGLPNPQCRLWQLMLQCWKLRPAGRPSIYTVATEVGEIFEQM